MRTGPLLVLREEEVSGMPSCRTSQMNAPVIGTKGKPLGTVSRTCCSTPEHRVDRRRDAPRASGYVVERKPHYFALDALEIGDGAGSTRSSAEASEATLLRPSASASTGRQTVIWRLPGRHESGEAAAMWARSSSVRSQTTAR